MNLNVLLLAMLLATTVADAFGQVRLRMHCDFEDTTRIERIERKWHDKNKVYLRMGYGGYEILNPKAINDLGGRQIEKIELVCTDYPKGVDAAMLNAKRLMELYQEVPTIFSRLMIRWELVEQTGCKSATEAYNFYHGFVISLRPPVTAASIDAEKNYLKHVIKGEVEVRDSTILKVFDRHSDWKDMVVVSDFTGSMSPYIAELLLWHHLNLEKKATQGFVFFNDGNATPNEEKLVGQTGGIYHTSEQNIDSVLITALTTLSHGDGGDGPENDVEALLWACQKHPDAKNIVLIADNRAEMRDIELIEQLNKPIKVVLCGVLWGINLQYLDLARKTGGSVHTIEQDINNLIDLNEGEIIKIGTLNYKIVNGKFMRLTGM